MGRPFLFPPRPDDTFDPDWVLLGLDAIARQTPTPARRIALRVSQGGKSASFLVQGGRHGTTISRVMEPGERFAYYHIETEDHALILAEGAPAETFVDNVSRRKFDNYAEYEALYGSEIPVPELDLPRAMSARQVPPATRARLTAVAAKIGQGKDAAA